MFGLVDMPKVIYTGTARMWRTAAHGGIAADRGEVIDVDQDAADWLTSEHEFERVSRDSEQPDSYPSGFGVLGGAISVIEERIESGAFDGQLNALETIEERNKDRTAVRDAIAGRRDNLDNNDDDD